MLVFVQCFIVVLRWMVFFEIFLHVGEDFWPDNFKLVVLSDIFYPVKINVKVF